MWLSLNIISKMVDINGISPEDLADKLTMSTAEIEEIEYTNRHLETVVAVKILNVTPHPDADKLTLVDVDKGDETLRVVCGAPNHKKGDIVPLATVGTSFDNGEFVIKKSKIRGEESNGMLCSAKELGFSEDHAGILIMPEDTEIGKTFRELYPDYYGVRLEIDNKSITHRPDLWSHVGFAREIGALLGMPVKNLINHDLEKDFKNTEKLEVTIKDPDGSPRYSGLVVKNIKIAESPDWLKAAVTSIGMRPINNIVDITNYVMAEIGQPMHAFDRKKLRGDEIIVRYAEDSEKLTTLDNQIHELTPEDIVIADQGGAIALAGVMGGGNSEIEDTTSEIILESANFNPVNIRKTAHRFNLRTDAAIRFEKSLTPELTIPALIRCYDLIKQIIPEAEAVTEIIDAYPVKPETITIKISTQTIRKRLGEEISDSRIIEILTSLDFRISDNNGNLSIEVPHYRATKDVSIAADIVEEVGRIYGYDNITPCPPLIPCASHDINHKRQFERKIKHVLSQDYNMTEVSGYSFVGETKLNKLKINEDRELRLRNPLSQEQDRLRRSIVPNIIGNIELNQRYHDEFSIYEFGRVYLKDDRKSPDLIPEQTRLTGVVFKKKPKDYLFYEIKNIITGLIGKIRLKSIRLIPESDKLPPYAHPGRSMTVMVEGKEAGIICELHPSVYREFEISGQAALFDLNMDVLFNAKKKEIDFTELQKFPEVPFEISVLADRYVYAGDICSIIEKTSRELIRSTEVLSVYEGEQIDKDKKSISIKIIFASKDKTLDSGEIEKLQNDVISALNKKGFELR